MHNYPRGMTRRDWEHIDGEAHYLRCPLHEDYEHECSEEAKKYVRQELNPLRWVFSVRTGHYSYSHIRIDYCPWCGEDLVYPGCECQEIDEAKRERALGI